MSVWLLGVVLVYLRVVSAVVPDPARFTTKPEEILVARNVTPLCLQHTDYWLTELRRGTPWALNMLDSYTKLPTGFLLGSHVHFGNFDQCLAVSVQHSEANFRGHYCRAYIDPIIPGEVLAPYGMWYAICVPSSCDPEEIQELMQNYIAPELGITINFVWGMNALDCHIEEPPAPLTTGAIWFIAIAATLTGLIVICALVEWRLGEKTPELVKAWSVTSTCRSLFNTRKHPADISCLHGIRVGSMLWVVIGHSYGQERWLPMSNPDIFATYFYNPLVMTIGNAMPSVDTFFFLSGLLMCTSFLRELSKSAALDIIKIYVYRYLRLATPIAFVIMFYISILILIGDGPLWNNYTYWEIRNCKANWWTNLAFVNNYIYHPGFGACLGQTWYTAIDMQLAWVSPLVFFPLYYSPRAGLQLMGLLVVISCLIPFTLTYIFRFPMASLQVWIDIPMEGVPEGGDYWRQIYTATPSRATPYLCGILIGYYIYKRDKKNIKLPKILIYLGWLCNTALALTIIYSLSIPHQPGYEYDLLASAFYGGFHRLGWSAVLAWIVFACLNGFGGIVDKILSWNLLLPISRLTYGAFLVHMIPLIYDSGTTKSMTHYSDYKAVHDFFGHLFFVFILAFYLYIVLEGPLIALLRLALKAKATTNPDMHPKKIMTENGSLPQKLQNGTVK